jgi:hypothetical protein
MGHRQHHLYQVPARAKGEIGRAAGDLLLIPIAVAVAVAAQLSSAIGSRRIDKPRQVERAQLLEIIETEKEEEKGQAQEIRKSCQRTSGQIEKGGFASRSSFSRAPSPRQLQLGA